MKFVFHSIRPKTGLGSAVLSRVSAYGTGGPGFNSRGRAILKTLKMVFMASLLGAQELRVSITTDLSVSVKDDRPGSSLWCAS